MLKAAANMIIVTPTGDDAESERGRLIVVNAREGQHMKYRGVIEHVGIGIHDGCAPGNVAIYTGFHEFEGKHLVPIQNMLAFEDDE